MATENDVGFWPFWCYFLLLATAKYIFNICTLSYSHLVLTEYILVQLWRKLLAYRNALESVPGINQYGHL